MITEWGGTDRVYPRVTFGALPDDVLLEMFDFYLALRYFIPDTWHTLVHVCKQWRSIVFASPHRLRLQLLYTNKRSVQNMLGIWPELPIVISGCGGMSEPQDANNILAVLERHNHVVKIDLDFISDTCLNSMRAMKMRNPFLVLTSLRLHSTQKKVPALPVSFLGGSVPRLQTLYLDGISFPALPTLLLSTHDLVDLSLLEIPLSGYISPEAMVSGLSALTRLKSLRLEFRSPRSWANRENRLLPRLPRVVLPSLTELYFKGDSEYLEDIMAQMDTRPLTLFKITFFNQLIFDTPSLRHFINRTETFKAAHQARVTFWEGEVGVELYPRNGNSIHEMSSLTISCRPSDWQLSSIVQVCGSALSPLLTLEHLEIYIDRSWTDDVENAQWVELLHPFTPIKDLFLYDESVPYVALALELLVEERVTEALPTLQNIFLDDPQPSEPVKKMIGKFIAAHQLSECPVSVHHRGSWQSSTWQQMHWEVGD